MKTSLLAITLALAAFQPQTPPQEAPLDAEHCKCSIEVTAKRGGTGEPIPGVDLQLRTATRAITVTFGENIPVYRGGPLSVQTDASGRAEFRDLAEGLYTVFAQRGAFSFSNGLGLALGSIYVGPREQRIGQVLFTERTGGSIRGRILDANHQPVHTAVSAYRVEYRNGQRSLEVAGTVEETNELGEYRLAPLTEGEYYIRTVSTLPQQNQTYYPGVYGPKYALPVTAREGQEISGIDFNIPAQKGVSVTGTIINTFPGGETLSNGQLLRAITSLYLVPRNTGFYFDFPQAIQNTIKGSSNTNNGTEFSFEIRNVPPGSYDLYPLFVDTATDAHVNRYISPTVIEVGTEDIQNFTAVLRKNTTLIVRASRDRSTASLTVPRVETSVLGVDLIPKDSQPSQFFTGRNAVGASVKPNEEASIPGLMDGRYAVFARLSGFSPKDHVSDIRQGPRSIFDDGYIEISQGAADPLEVIVSSGGGTVQGRIENIGQNKIPIGVKVTLLPDPPRRQNLMLYRSSDISPDGNGAFNFTGIAPGTYKVFAWVNLPAGAEQNEEFMRGFENRGTRVVIGSDVTVTDIKVPLISVR